MIVLVYDTIYGYLNLLILNDYVASMIRRLTNLTCKCSYAVKRLLRLLRFRYLEYWHPE